MKRVELCATTCTSGASLRIASACSVLSSGKPAFCWRKVRGQSLYVQDFSLPTGQPALASLAASLQRYRSRSCDANDPIYVAAGAPAGHRLLVVQQSGTIVLAARDIGPCEVVGLYPGTLCTPAELAGKDSPLDLWYQSSVQLPTGEEVVFDATLHRSGLSETCDVRVLDKQPCGSVPGASVHQGQHQPHPPAEGETALLGQHETTTTGAAGGGSGRNPVDMAGAGTGGMCRAGSAGWPLCTNCVGCCACSHIPQGQSSSRATCGEPEVVLQHPGADLQAGTGATDTKEPARTVASRSTSIVGTKRPACTMAGRSVAPQQWELAGHERLHECVLCMQCSRPQQPPARGSARYDCLQEPCLQEHGGVLQERQELTWHAGWTARQGTGDQDDLAARAVDQQLQGANLLGAEEEAVPTVGCQVPAASDQSGESKHQGGSGASPTTGCCNNCQGNGDGRQGFSSHDHEAAVGPTSCGSRGNTERLPAGRWRYSVSHKLEANAALVGVLDLTKTAPEEQLVLAVVALRDIRKGDEVMLDYGDEYWACR